MDDPKTVIDAFLGSGEAEERLRRLKKMDFEVWRELGHRFEDLLRAAKAKPAGAESPFASWENDERSSLALLLVHALRWHASRSEALRANVAFDLEEMLERMLARGHFGLLSPADTALLGLATDLLDPKVGRRVPALRARTEKAPRPARAAGEIELPRRLRSQLFRLREALMPGAPPRLLLDDVVSAEKGLGVTFPSALLGLIAVLGTSPATIALLTKDLRRERGLGAGVIATGQETIDLNGYFMPICASCDDDGRADWVFAWDYKHETELAYRVGSEDQGSDFSTFLTWRWGRYQTLPKGRAPLDLETPNVDLDAAVSEEELAAFRPAIVAAEARRRVRHPKFGEGELVAEKEGKCTVAFASGTKTLLAGVLTRVD